MGKRVVVKLGTSSLTAGTNRLNRAAMLRVVQQLAALHHQGYEVILVSSGAQAAGRERLNYPELPKAMPVKQMLSAVGQSRLMQRYNELFDIFEIPVAQVLLTRDDLSHRTRYLNARDTLQTLLTQRIVPIVNENDTIATEEIRVGDNDNLSALVASALEADLLIILTDQAGLYTADPRVDPHAQLIPEVAVIDESVLARARGAGTRHGTGGMITKLQAAQVATRSGVTVVIASASVERVIERLVEGEAIGTRFLATSTHLESRKRWLLTDRPQGRVVVDAGAERALLRKNSASLLPVGIVACTGDFKRGATLAVFSQANREIAHGLTNYDADDLKQIIGQQSSRIVEILGYTYGDEVIHRSNMVILVESSG
jgi:glutamate 5-kinase